ncbi:hypothetical protein COBT_002454 [Conglomerata obtusa]
MDDQETKAKIEEDDRQSSKNVTNEEDEKETKQELSKFSNKISDQIINIESTVQNYSKKDEESDEEKIGKKDLNNIQEESEYDSDEITNLKVLNICLLVYREITMVFSNLLIENNENLFSIYEYVYNVFVNLKENKLKNNKTIEAFYKNFFNKILRIDLFNTKKIKNNKKTQQMNL